MLDDQSHKIRIKPVRVMLLLFTVGAIYYLMPQFGEFDMTMSLLGHSSWLWIAIAVLAMVLSFVVAAMIQYAAGNSIGRIRDLIALGFAGSFLNHFLPFSVGGIGLITEYYRRLGQQRSQAIIIATMPIIIGAISTILLVLVISPITFMQFARNLRTSFQFPIVIGAMLLTFLFLFLYRRKLKKAIIEAEVGLRGVQSLRQAAKVAGGSIVLALVASVALYASIQAIHGQAALVVIIALFITSVLVGEIAPTPGGIGATEAVLVLGLSGAGLTAPQAIAATLVFRFVTFMLPLLPGAVAMAQLDRLVGPSNKVGLSKRTI